jgi:tripartite-type tricarboxylate transporter receptor subunit TctC
MKEKFSQMVILVVVGLLVCCGVDALGQSKEFPTKPITLYIGFSPGGSTSNTGTIVAEGMKKYLGQPVILGFKPGAAQIVAAEFVKNSEPDGYNLFYVAPADLAAKVTKEGSKLKFRFEDLEPLGGGPYTPQALAVNAESPWKSLEDLIANARKSPGKLNFGSSGAGNVSQMLGELLEIKAGIDLNHVPFNGGGACITALLGKHVHMGFLSVSTYGPHILEGGGLRALVVFGNERHPKLPNVPTAIESGYDIAFATWFGMLAPKGIPKAVKTTLVQAFKKTMEDPQVISSLGNMGLTVSYLSPEEVENRIQKEYKLVLSVWEKIGLVK